MPQWVKLVNLPQPRSVADLSPTEKFYKEYKLLKTGQEVSRVAAVGYSPVSPHQLAVVSGTKVNLWKNGPSGELEADASISKFKDMTQCVAYRSDGRLILAGEASGSCAVIEAGTRNVLRRFRGHGDAVTCAAFATADRTRAATGGRDGKMRIWDVATCELLSTTVAHKDTMKCLFAGPGGPDAWISAGYDGLVKLWDMRAPQGQDGQGSGEQCARSMDHGHPVEAGTPFPGSAMFASVGGTDVKLWDVTSGRFVHGISGAHAKTIMGISLDSKAEVLLTASFDGHAKLFNAANLGLLCTYKLPGPATCVAWKPNDRAFVVGLDDGQWQVRQRRGEVEVDPEVAAEKEANNVNAAKKRKLSKMRGQDAKPDSDDEIVEPVNFRQKKEATVDFFLRKLDYLKAVEFVVTTNGESLCALLDELMQRNMLRDTLRVLDSRLCNALLKVLNKNLATADALQQHLIYEAMHTLFDNNQHLRPPSTPELVKTIWGMEKHIQQMVNNQEMLIETSGVLKTVMNLS